jgi:hypothetical protein
MEQHQGNRAKDAWPRNCDEGRPIIEGGTGDDIIEEVPEDQLLVDTEQEIDMEASREEIARRLTAWRSRLDKAKKRDEAGPQDIPNPQKPS